MRCGHGSRRPLKELLAQTAPEIKYVYGSPDNTSTRATGGTYIKLFFVDKDEVKKRYNKKLELTGITVRFKLEIANTRKPIPIGGININSVELAKEYGDMVISGIYVSEN